jgi:sulfoxide reductase heme-binding subunit YedZ
MLFIVGLAPLLFMLSGALNNSLGSDPAKTLAHISGGWSLRFLLLTLCITPIKQISGSNEWLRYRRMLGLFAFFYASCHLIIYFAFLLAFQWSELWADIAERPYIYVGVSAWLLMLPLAVTSTQGWQKRLRRNWRRLHRLIYIVVVFGLIHLIWQVRSDWGEALLYAGLIALLLILRIPFIVVLLRA